MMLLTESLSVYRCLDALCPLLIFQINNNRTTHLSFFGLVQQQLRVDHLVELYSRNGLTNLQCSHLHAQFSLVHEVADGKSRRNGLPVLAIKQYLAFFRLLIDQFVDVVEVYNNCDVLVDGEGEVVLVGFFEFRLLVLHAVINEIEEANDSQVGQLLLAVR